MAAMDEKQLLEGSATPLAVKWADPELQIKKRRAVEDSNAENRMVRGAQWTQVPCSCCAALAVLAVGPPA
jgi:hypothetical protein